MKHENVNPIPTDEQLKFGRKRYWGDLQISHRKDCDLLEALNFLNTVVLYGTPTTAKMYNTTVDKVRSAFLAYGRNLPILIIQGRRIPNVRIGHMMLFDIPDRMTELKKIGRYKYAKKYGVGGMEIRRFECIFFLWNSETLRKKLVENSKPKSVLDEFYSYR